MPTASSAALPGGGAFQLLVCGTLLNKDYLLHTEEQNEKVISEVASKI